VLLRIVFEFGPPLIVAIVLVRYAPPSEKGPVAFSVAFFSVSWFWAQLLRIWYQEDQRARFAEFGADIRFIKSAVEFIKRNVGKAPIKRQVPVKPSARAASRNVQKLIYFVDFRARTAGSYGHAFTWYGRTDQVQVAGLHPASDSIIPYILGHFVPVPSETGASYGDLDEEYLTASYRVWMDEAEAARVFKYIKYLQATSPVWNAAIYNCVAFIQDIARYMGLQVPGNHLLYPEKWINQLQALNGDGEIGRPAEFGITSSTLRGAQAQSPP
jgi:hypothetical protein